MADEGRALRVACVQMRSGVDRQKNVEAARELIAEAAGAGARFVATPEMTNVVDRDAQRLFSHLQTEEASPEVAAFADMAAAHGIWLLIGSMAFLAGDGRAANRGLLYAPDGSIAARYDKIHMFDVSLPNGESWTESKVYSPGATAPIVDVDAISIGLTICYDLRFPHLFRSLAKKGATVLCVPAAFTRQTGRAHWEILLRARAIENGAFVVAPAQGGTHEDGRETWGRSLIIGPWGDVRAQIETDEPGVVLADLDLSAAAKARRAIPNLGLDQPFEVLNTSS